MHLKYTHEMELKIQFRNIGRDNNLTKTLSRKHQSQSWIIEDYIQKYIFVCSQAQNRCTSTNYCQGLVTYNRNNKKRFNLCTLGHKFQIWYVKEIKRNDSFRVSQTYLCVNWRFDIIKSQEIWDSSWSSQKHIELK